MPNAKLGAKVDRYSFFVRLLPPLLHAGLARRTNIAISLTIWVLSANAWFHKERRSLNRNRPMAAFSVPEKQLLVGAAESLLRTLSANQRNGHPQRTPRHYDSPLAPRVLVWVRLQPQRVLFHEKHCSRSLVFRG